MDVAADGGRVVLHVHQVLGERRGAGAVGQTHPQVEHDLETQGEAVPQAGR